MYVHTYAPTYTYVHTYVHTYLRIIGVDGHSSAQTTVHTLAWLTIDEQTNKQLSLACFRAVVSTADVLRVLVQETC